MEFETPYYLNISVQKYKKSIELWIFDKVTGKLINNFCRYCLENIQIYEMLDSIDKAPKMNDRI